MTKLNDEQRQDIVIKAREGQSKSSLAREYGVCSKTIARILAAADTKEATADSTSPEQDGHERSPLSPADCLAAEHAEIDAQMQRGLDRVAADSKRRSALSVDIGSHIVVKWGATSRTYGISPHELAKDALEFWSKWRQGIKPLRDEHHATEVRGLNALDQLDESRSQVRAIKVPMENFRDAFYTWCMADAIGHRLGVEETRAALNGDDVAVMELYGEDN